MGKNGPIQDDRQPDLFDIAAGSADSDGYRELLSPPSPPGDLFSFDFRGEDGYERWRERERERLKAISKEWGVPVCENARVAFSWADEEFEGYVAPLEWPETISRKKHGPLKMRLNPDGNDFALGPREEIEFLSDEVVSWKRSPENADYTAENQAEK
jgi:hypothetical protein